MGEEKPDWGMLELIPCHWRPVLAGAEDALLYKAGFHTCAPVCGPYHCP